MSKDKPLVSIVMPAYNAAKYIEEAIQSIIDQTFSDFEFIIVDDCSNDETWEIITKYSKKDGRLVAIKNSENLKISATLNKGILASKGKYIARMDADDWSYPDRIEKQVRFMESHPEIGISGGYVEFCNTQMDFVNQRTYPLVDSDIRKKLFRYSPFCHATTIYRSVLVKKAGLYDINLYDAEDYDLYFRLGNLAKFANLPVILYKVRMRSDSISQTKTVRQESLTFFIRHKAVIEYHYKINLADKLFTLLQFTLGQVIPAKFKFRLFNILRSKNFF